MMSAKSGLDRATFTVGPYLGGWAVEHDGEFSSPFSSQEEARADANKRARAAQDAGRPCQVRVSGELGFFATTAGR